MFKNRIECRSDFDPTRWPMILCSACAKVKINSWCNTRLFNYLTVIITLLKIYDSLQLFSAFLTGHLDKMTTWYLNTKLLKVDGYHRIFRMLFLIFGWRISWCVLFNRICKQVLLAPASLHKYLNEPNTCNIGIIIRIYRKLENTNINIQCLFDSRWWLLV